MELPGHVFVNHCPDDEVWCREFVSYLAHSGVEVHYHDFHRHGITVTTSMKPDLEAFPVFIAILSPAFLTSPDCSLVSEAALLSEFLKPDHVLNPDEHSERFVFLVVASECNVPPGWRQAWRTFRLIQDRQRGGLDPHEAAARVLKELQMNDTTPKYQANKALDRARDLMRVHRGEEALDAIEAAITFQPESSYYWVHKAQILGQLGRVEEALKAFAVAQSIDPQNAHNWAAMGHVLVDRGRIVEAIAAYRVATSLAPHDVLLWSLLGHVAIMSHDPLESLRAFEEALARDPTNHDLWAGKAIALGELGRNDEALVAWRHAKTTGTT